MLNKFKDQQRPQNKLICHVFNKLKIKLFNYKQIVTLMIFYQKLITLNMNLYKNLMQYPNKVNNQLNNGINH